MEQQNVLVGKRQIEQEQKDNLLGESSVEVDGIAKQKSLQPPIVDVKILGQQNQLIDPIEQLLKNNNIMPLVAIIDQVQLDRRIEEKPLLSLMATKFIPLDIILKDRQISFPLDEDRRTPLHYAIQANDIKAAAWLIEKGNPNKQDNFGNTPILDAIRLGRRRCFLLCLKNKMYDERAPIFAATHNRHWELKLLHGLKFDIFKYRDEQNRSSFERALQYCSFDCGQFMIKVQPNLPIQKYESVTQSKGLIRRLKRIRNQNSALSKIIQLIKPTLIILTLIIGLNFNTFNFQKQTFPYDDTKSFYWILIALIVGLYGLMFSFGSFCKGNVEYAQKNTLSQILMEPNYQTLEEICPNCVHFTDYRYQHCYSCGYCVQKYHFHSFVCVNKSNQVFWIICEVIWLYLIGSLLQEFKQVRALNNLAISSVSSFEILKFIASLSDLYEKQSYVSIAWILGLGFLFFYQLIYCLTILGMMSMRRKFPEVINSQKYHHLFDIVQVDASFVSKQKRIFERGFIPGCIRCVRNALLYFFIDN